MSTLVAQTISNGTVSTSSENVIRGSARAWVNFNGVSSVTVRASYNVSSVTRNNTGDYTINFTNALPDANYSWNGNNTRSTIQTNGDVCFILAAVPTTTTLRFITATGSGTATDSLYTTVAVFD
jgi:hypothetical protein